MHHTIRITIRSTIVPALLASVFLLPAPARAVETIDLAGTWRFALDRTDVGVEQGWPARTLAQTIRLPGILNAQGHGDPISASTPWVLSLYDRQWHQREDYKAYTKEGQVKVPFLSQPPRHYLGAAWYARDVTVPKAWAGKRVTLFMERPRWGSTVWVDGREVGANRSLVAEHVVDLGQLSPGTHRIAVRVDSRMQLNYRLDSHSVSDSLGMSWNGIVGKIELRATSPVYIDDAQVYPDVATRSARVVMRIGNAGGRAGSGTVLANGKRVPVSWTEAGGQAEFTVQYPKNAKTWDEFTPALQTMSLALRGDGARAALDTRRLSFGFVQIRAEGMDMLVNGRPVFMRGTHHGGDFPLTGYPPTDVEYWKKIFRINKAWGINHVRFHSFNPPEAAFQAADEVGIYLQPEPGMWNSVSPGSPLEAMLYEETERMIRAYGNHPSFLLLSPSNEPSGRWKESFDKWIAHYRERDPRRLYTNGTGHTEPSVPKVDEGTDYLAIQRIGPKPLRNKTGWFGRDYAASLEGVKVPVLAHETGQWVAYPDFSIIDKFTGYLRPGNYEIFRDSARDHGVLEKNRDFALASGKWQLAAYKEEIEAVLRTRGMSGFQLLDLHDYLGQGTALVGVLDTFWEPKGYATAEQFRRFNGETVPLARLTRLVLTTKDKLDVPVEIAHYGKGALAKASPWWRVEDARGKAVLEGRFDTRAIPIGKNTPLGRIDASLAALPAPAQYKLVVGLAGTRVANDWNFWLYPEQVTPAQTPSVLVTQSWNTAEAALKGGGKVLYLPRKADLDWTSPPLADVPVFWNRLMNPGWGRMLGLSIDAKHPALAGFPTESHFDWQWSELVNGARAMNLDRLPRDLAPIVQPIDDWNRNYKLGTLFEAQVGPGKLLVSTFDLEGKLASRPVARQLRQSVLDYMASTAFAPKTTLAPEALRATLFDTRVMKKLGATASGWPDAANTIDGDPNTYALVSVRGDAPRPQPVLNIAFDAPVPFAGLVLMPRQNHREHEGDVREWRIEVSDDGAAWRELQRATLGSTFDPQTVRFAQPVTARHLRLTALSGFGTDRASALADVAVLYAGPALPEEEGELEYKRSRAASSDIDEAGMEERKPKR
ncbi:MULTISPECIES: sugar-binding domain-containing protein [unclassified Massilia]|uniref:sugar-binding domain-containing protein n=1 Tax=unclassified Massilia TaxID=2609279 RepID=UPI00177C4238|nr:MULTISPECIES: sugar-binding domain-containing protein [unclassified Massilia]MBD8531094.1 discoidin domain-containing protein [Massilia sp. CFBP 13647]MBD8674794.1 discoidin domain-containing protein [Massilia sp. CFBP 13721]